MIKCPCCGFEFERGSVAAEEKNPLVLTRLHAYEYSVDTTTAGNHYRCKQCGKRAKNQFDLTDCVGFGVSGVW